MGIAQLGGVRLQRLVSSSASARLSNPWGYRTKGKFNGCSHELRIDDATRLHQAGLECPDWRWAGRRPATSGRGRARWFTVHKLHIDLDGRRTEPLRDVRPQARRSEGDPRRIRADPDRGSRSLLLRVDEAAGIDRG